MTSWPEIEPRSRWWEVSALTSMPPLLSKTGSFNSERNADVLFYPKFQNVHQTHKARLKRRTLHVPNLMQMTKMYCFRSFALDSVHVKFDV